MMGGVSCVGVVCLWVESMIWVLFGLEGGCGVGVASVFFYFCQKTFTIYFVMTTFHLVLYMTLCCIKTNAI